jgi:hypothetical protein
VVSPPVRSFEIVVNGVRVRTTAVQANFEQIVAHALPELGRGAERMFTVLFRNGSARRPAGLLVPGEVIDIVEDEEFVVAAADRS